MSTKERVNKKNLLVADMSANEGGGGGGDPCPQHFFLDFYLNR